MLAFALLDRLERLGPGAKVSRDDVQRLFGTLMADIEAGARLDLKAAASA